MSRYSHVFFDLDNTIFDFQASSNIALKVFADALGEEYNEAFKAVYHKHNHAAWTKFEMKLIDGITLRKSRFEDTAKELGKKIDGLIINRRYLAQLVKNPHFIQDAEATLQKYSKSHTLIAVTNGLKEVQRPRLRKVDFEKYFSHIVVSDEIGVAKPDAAYFQYAWEKAGQPDKSKVLMVGDNPFSDIKGGHDFGFDTCYFDAFNKSREIEKATYSIRTLKELEGILS